VIPAIDPLTHSIEVRAELPAGTALQPGQFASLFLPLRETSSQLRIPMSAVLRRSEVIGVYVVAADGAAHLRQVRLGAVIGDSVIVLSGLQSGERVALDPVAAGRR
jgi:multidrug efflux pump subunit AcrA (membrane-fusion protein)